MKKELFEWLQAIVVGVLFVLLVRAFIFSPVTVEGASMMPTYEDGDKVIVNKIGMSLGELERFDVIVFKATEKDNYIKRIIGVPGDHIAYQNDELYINGEKYEEPYLAQYKAQLKDGGKLTYDFSLEELTGVTEVPEGYYFVLGDNRRKSNDSRSPSVGLISEDAIMGEASLRIYPFNQIGIVK